MSTKINRVKKFGPLRAYYIHSTMLFHNNMEFYGILLNILDAS
jgi:hypothetical protein